MDYVKELAKFEDYLERRVRPGTVKVYSFALKCWFNTLNGNKPTQETAQQYVDMLAKTKSPSTVGVRAHAIMRWFKWKGTLISLDCPTIRMGDPDYLTIKQVEELLATCKSVLERTIVTVLLDTATRINELLGLEVDKIDWEHGLIFVTGKGGREEAINISERGLTALNNWLDTHDQKSKKVFPGLSYIEAWFMVRRIGARVGLDIHPHIFRHTRAVQMLMSGATLHIVQQHLRHASITTTANIYGRFRALDLKEKVPTW